MKKKLFRSRKDKMIGGVAGGLGEYFDIDPTLIRIIFVVSLFIGGSGFLAYIILWIVVPQEPFVFQMPDSSPNPAPPQEPSQNTGGQDAFQSAEIKHTENKRNVVGGILIVIGILFLADNFIPRFHFGDFWPLIIIAIGVGLLLKSRSNN